MSRKTGRSAPRNKGTGVLAVAVLFLCFCAAGAVGCFAAGGVSGSGSDALSEYLADYLALLTAGEAAVPSVWSVAWELCRWPLLAFALGFTALGAAALPVVFLCRGFLLGYAAAAFIKVFGSRGALLAGTVFGMTALVSVPVFFFVGTLSFRSALSLAAGVPRDLGVPTERFWGMIPCGAFLLAAVLIQWAVIPELLSVLSGSFL